VPLVEQALLTLPTHILTGLVKVSQEFALQYQTMVVELLDDPDETIRRKVRRNLSRKVLSYQRSNQKL
jgi:hypothetical protein